MAITDPTIDPVTGLPVLNPADVIQQIPLGVQIFPYDDLEATARPTRGPLYGDDILPVSSLTAGQHPSTGSAQTVGTDGNHRLLVSGEGGGGGPTPAQYRTNSGQVVATLCAANDSVGLDDVSAATYIYGVTWWATIDPAATPFTGSVHYTLYLAPQADISQHVFCGFGGWSVGSSGVTSDLLADSKTILFPVPIDRALTWPGAVNIFLFLDATNAGVYCGGSALTG